MSSPSPQQPPIKRRRIDASDDENDENDANDPPPSPPSPPPLRVPGTTIPSSPTPSQTPPGSPLSPPSSSYGDDDVDEEEEEIGEDLMDNAMRDYAAIPALDTYGTEGIDDAQYDNLSVTDRLAAERELRKRDRISRGLQDEVEEWMEVEEGDEERRLRRARFERRRDDGDGGGDDDAAASDASDGDDEDEVNLEAFDVPLREWIAQDRTRREIQRRFRRFLNGFVQSGSKIYERRLKTMASRNGTSVEVSYVHLSETEPILAIWLADAPRDMLEILDETATRATLRLFPNYGTVVRDETIRVRVSDLPVVDSLRDLRNVHLHCLVKVSGVVTRRTVVYPKVSVAYYNCGSCKELLGPFGVDESVSGGTSGGDGGVSKPSSCPRCHDPENPGAAQSFKLNNQHTRYRNFQRMMLQEAPGSVPPGRAPRSKEIILADDLIDAARPGELVEITGTYLHSYDLALSTKSGFPVFSTHVLANHVLRKMEDFETSLTESEKKQIIALSKDPQIVKKICDSIAPSIYGHDDVKLAIAMSLFGGNGKTVAGSQVRIRGDVNVLLLGDPGTAKSQFLKYAERTAPRAVYSAGKGASAVGLTASVRKDPLTREWTLEGGALVLADRGVCLIDEFDKMNEQDRTSIHEAMEQQTISVSKAGIVTSLQARCSVVAAANPIGGRYDSSLTLAENVELTDPILQRFDCLCVLQDEVDPVSDERLAMFVTGSHMRCGGGGGGEEKDEKVETGPISQQLLKKYIQYAKSTTKPSLRATSIDRNKISSLYVALRKESQSYGGVPIAVRHIESILRMSEAHAKMHLRSNVREDDVDAAIRTMLKGFITSQKFSVRRVLTQKFKKFVIEEESKEHLLSFLLKEMMRNEMMYQTIKRGNVGRTMEEDMLEVSVEEFEGRARERKVYDIKKFLEGESFKEQGYVWDHSRGVIVRLAQASNN